MTTNIPVQNILIAHASDVFYALEVECQMKKYSGYLRDQFSEFCTVSFGDADKTLLSLDAFGSQLYECDTIREDAGAWDAIRQKLEADGVQYIDIVN